MLFHFNVKTIILKINSTLKVKIQQKLFKCKHGECPTKFKLLIYIFCLFIFSLS